MLDLISILGLKSILGLNSTLDLNSVLDLISISDLTSALDVNLVLDLNFNFRIWNSILPKINRPNLIFSRSWHGLDGQPMPLWMPPMPTLNNNEFRVDEHLSCLYQMNLMEEADLPAIYVKKELKRNSDVPDLEKKIRKEDGFNSQGGTYAPRYILKRFTFWKHQFSQN